MHIIAASYFNIGPFEDQIISIFLKSGKYLIKAPIGSGKSFLFFDGLVFALYGYSKRDMLNVHSTQGWSKILFRNDQDDYYLIERPLTGKKGVKLWKFPGSSDHFIFPGSYEVITRGEDILSNINLNTREEIDFHRASEIQQHIDLLLPPRSVFLQRHILMQDSDTIFDLPPKGRIDILKLMFGLDMIDSLRDKLSELKQTYKVQYNALNESTHLRTHYADRIAKFKPLIGKIQGILHEYSFSHPSLSCFQPLIDLYQDPLSDNVDTLNHDFTNWDITPFIDYLSNSVGQKISFQQELDSINTQLTALRSTLALKQQRLTQVQQELSQIDHIGSDPSALQVSLDAILEEKKKIASFLQELFSLEELSGSLIQKQSEYDLQLAKQETFHIKLGSKEQKREHLVNQLHRLQNNQREHFVQEHTHTIQRLTQSLESLSEKQTLIRSQQQSLLQTIDRLSDQLKSKKSFSCSLIDHKPCPFVDQIIIGSGDALTKQLDVAQQQYTQGEEQLRLLQVTFLDYQKQLTDANNQLGSLNQEQFHYTGDEYTTLKDQIELLNKDSLTESEKLEQATIQTGLNHTAQSLQEIRNLYDQKIALYGLERKKIYQQQKQLFEEKESELGAVQQKLSTIQHHIGALATLQTTLTLHQQELQDLQDSEQKLNQRIDVIQQQLFSPLYQIAETLLPLLQSCDKGIIKAQDLYYEKKRIEKESLHIKQQLDTSTLLHTIFGKELTLYVLRAYLPLLNEHINAFLAKVVDFQLRIEISSDGDELELMIDDTLGSREVKSLSGGQKTLLRLCWILATSVVFRNSFLLLDETINSIDQSTIAQVAELLSDFITQYNLTLYTVTHSTHIQDMQIRDQLLVIPTQK